MNVNLADRLLYDPCYTSGDKCAIAYSEGARTYIELGLDVTRVATGFHQLGLNRGDLVILVMHDTRNMVAALFAAMSIGAVPVIVPASITFERLAALVTKTRPRAIVARSSFSFIGSLGYAPPIFIEENGHVFPSVSVMLANGEFQGASHSIATSEYAYCLLSSGTTGLPKIIPHRHEDILLCARAYADSVLSMGATDVVVSVPKLSFGYGLGGLLLFSMWSGGTAVLNDLPVSGSALLSDIEQYDATIALLQPRIIVDILNSGRADELSRLRIAVTAGETLSTVILDRWLSVLSVPLLDGFGCTEVGHIFISNRIDSARRGAAGRVLDGFDVEIVDDIGCNVHRGDVGRLRVKGNSVATEYLFDDERSAVSFRDGWFESNDLFRVDGDDYLYYCGRADDLIKVGCGQWVNPTEIEQALLEHEDVLECVVNGVSDEYGIVRLCAYVTTSVNVEPQAGAGNLTVALKDLVMAEWPADEWRHLYEVVVMTALPRSLNGKISRNSLRPAPSTEFSYDC